MPMITVKYDDTKVADDSIVVLSRAIQKIVIDATGIPEVFVYADSPKIKVDVAPIEIFVEMSAHKIADKDSLFLQIKSELSQWKKETSFEHPITITLIPMNWIFEVNI